MSSTIPSVDGWLREAGLRRTPMRVGVLDLLARGERPMSVAQILEQLGDADSVTAYRTLNTFVEKGLVHRIRGEDRSWLYALSPASPSPNSDAQHKHPHFVCESCGVVECLESSEIPGDFVQSLGVDPEYTISWSEVVLHGVCPKCHE